MFDLIWSNADKIGALAQVGIVCIGFFAFFSALAQIRNSRKQQREATAYSIYGEQLRLDLQYPQYARPNYSSIQTAGQKGQYEDYVSHLLYSCENILEISEAPGWRAALKYCLRPHAHFLRDQMLDHKDTLNDDVVRLIEEVIAELPASTPPADQ